jgi:hypothetical protein
VVAAVALLHGLAQQFAQRLVVAQCLLHARRLRVAQGVVEVGV